MADFQEGEQRFIDGDTIIKQSPMAWMLPAFPWVVILSVAAFTDFLTMGILPVGLAMLVVLPRYFSWRSSKFILTNKAIIVSRSGFGKSSEFELGNSARVIAGCGLCELHGWKMGPGGPGRVFSGYPGL